MRGILLTLCVLLLAAAMLYLITTISLYSSNLKSTPSELSAFESMNMQYDSVAYGINQILAHEKVNVTTQSTNLSFQSNLTTSNNYYRDLSRFKQFVVGEASVNTSINLTGIQEPRMYIQPHNIIVNYGIGSVNFDPENSTASSGDVAGYDLFIKIDQVTPWQNWTNISEVLVSDPNALLLHVGLQGTNGTIAMTKYLDRDNYNELDLLNTANQTIIAISVYPTANLTINYNLDMYLKTIVRLNSSASVEMDENAINISTIYAEKLGKVIVVEN